MDLRRDRRKDRWKDGRKDGRKGLEDFVAFIYTPVSTVS